MKYFTNEKLCLPPSLYGLPLSLHFYKKILSSLLILWFSKNPNFPINMGGHFTIIPQNVMETMTIKFIHESRAT